MKSILLGDEKQIGSVFPPAVRAELEGLAGLEAARVYTKAQLLEQPLPGVEAVFSTWGMPVFSEDEIARALPDLKAVFYAAGTVKAFALPFLRRGIQVFSAWAANAVPVAEYTVAQIILANKGFFGAQRRFDSRAGFGTAKDYASHFPGSYGCKVGLVGAGMIGRLVAELLKAYRLEVLVYDPYLAEEKAAELGVRQVPLETLFSECRIVSNHVANIPETVGMFDYALFSRMPQYATFLNTGRGAQVIEEDLARVLKERPDLTAVLDVTWPEPPEAGHPFYQLENCILTPHIAGSSGDEVVRMAAYMVEECRRYIKGEPTLYAVSEAMLATMA